MNGDRAVACPAERNRTVVAAQAVLRGPSGLPGHRLEARARVQLIHLLAAVLVPEGLPGSGVVWCMAEDAGLLLGTGFDRPPASNG